MVEETFGERLKKLQKKLDDIDSKLGKKELGKKSDREVHEIDSN